MEFVIRLLFIVSIFSVIAIALVGCPPWFVMVTLSAEEGQLALNMSI